MMVTHVSSVILVSIILARQPKRENHTSEQKNVIFKTFSEIYPIDLVEQQHEYCLFASVGQFLFISNFLCSRQQDIETSIYR